MIGRYVEENNIVAGTKGQYQFVKRIISTHSNANTNDHDNDDSVEEELGYTLPVIV